MGVDARQWRGGFWKLDSQAYRFHLCKADRTSGSATGVAPNTAHQMFTFLVPTYQLFKFGETSLLGVRISKGLCIRGIMGVWALAWTNTGTWEPELFE